LLSDSKGKGLFNVQFHIATKISAEFNHEQHRLMVEMEENNALNANSWGA
jgi:hypothetical protein